ncbi:hypothetical protein [[Flexibacter] sp. ATCC 35208]|nr:hypothetical protein [[Flexibacter] sp. ATCC 35208]
MGNSDNCRVRYVTYLFTTGKDAMRKHAGVAPGEIRNAAVFV